MKGFILAVIVILALVAVVEFFTRPKAPRRD